MFFVYFARASRLSSLLYRYTAVSKRPLRQRFDHDGSQNRKHNSENNKYFILKRLARAQSWQSKSWRSVRSATAKKKSWASRGVRSNPSNPPPTGLSRVSMHNCVGGRRGIFQLIKIFRMPLFSRGEYSHYILVLRPFQL